MKLLYLLIFLILFLYSCSKPVYTVFYKDSNQTIFTTKEIKISTTDNRELNLVVSKNCPGRTMCPVNELKLIITLETQFSFLEAKDFYIKTDTDRFDLNSRDYRFIYDVTKKAPDGTSGVAIETWTVWIKTEDFKKIAQSKIVILEIGEHSILVNMIIENHGGLLWTTNLYMKHLVMNKKEHMSNMQNLPQ